MLSFGVFSQKIDHYFFFVFSFSTSIYLGANIFSTIYTFYLRFPIIHFEERPFFPRKKAAWVFGSTRPLVFQENSCARNFYKFLDRNIYGGFLFK